MNTKNKRIRKILLAIIVFIILLILAIPYVIDPNNYKAQIEEAARKATGRELNIGGHINWSFFPKLGFRISNIRMKDKEKFGGKDLLLVNNAVLNLDLLSMLKKDFQFGKVGLKGAQINIIRLANGETNFQDLLQEIQKDSKNSKITSSKLNNKKTNKINLKIAEIELENATIQFNDLSKLQTTKIEKLYLKSKDIAFDNKFPLEIGFKGENKSPFIIGEFALKTDVQINQDINKIKLTSLNAKTSLSGKEYFPKENKLELNIPELDVDLITKLYHCPKASLIWDDLLIKLNLNSQLEASSPIYNGKLEIPEFSFKEQLVKLDPSLLANLPDNSLQKFALQTNFSATHTMLSLTKFNFNLDDSKAFGKFSYAFSAQPQIDFEININEIDFDKFLNKKSYKSTRQEKIEEDIENEQGKFVNKITLNGEINIDRMKIFNLVAGKVAAKIRANPKQILLAPMKALFYEGNYDGNIQVNLKNEQWSAKQTMTDVNLHDLLIDFNGLENIWGLAAFDLDIKGNSLESKNIMENIKGSVNLKLNNGYYQGIDLLNEWYRIQRLLGNKTPKYKASDKTEIGELQASFNIENGIAQNNDLRLFNDNLYAKGNGKIDFTKYTMDYNLTLHKTKMQKDSLGRKFFVPEKPGFPITLSGPITKPVPYINPKVIRNILLDKASDKLLDTINDKIEDEEAGKTVKDFLNEIFQ